MKNKMNNQEQESASQLSNGVKWLKLSRKTLAMLGIEYINLNHISRITYDKKLIRWLFGVGILVFALGWMLLIMLSDPIPLITCIILGGIAGVLSMVLGRKECYIWLDSVHKVPMRNIRTKEDFEEFIDQLTNHMNSTSPTMLPTLLQQFPVHEMKKYEINSNVEDDKNSTIKVGEISNVADERNSTTKDLENPSVEDGKNSNNETLENTKIDLDMLGSIANFGNLDLLFEEIDTSSLQVTDMKRAKAMLDKTNTLSESERKAIGTSNFWVKLGRVFQKTGEDAFAELCYRFALEQEPNNAYTWARLGVVIKDKKERFNYFRKALEMDPSVKDFKP